MLLQKIRMYTRLKRLFVFLIEDVSMLWYISGFVTATILFGIVYAELTPMGHGIGQDFKPLSEVTYLIGVYFSVVTISSLGYGNMHPMGVSMALTSMEVLIGLVMIGIMIAKITSQRLSYHVSRLFSSDAQKRLEDIAEKYEKVLGDLKVFIPGFDVPSRTSKSEDRLSEFTSGFRKTIGELRLRCVELHDYIAFEIERGDYFKVAPSSEMERVGKAANEVFFALSQLVRDMSTQARTETLDHHTRQDVSKSVDLLKKVCDMVCDNAISQAVINNFRETRLICGKVPASYFEVPEEPQPDQVLQYPDEPQENTGMDSEPANLPQ